MPASNGLRLRRRVLSVVVAVTVVVPLATTAAQAAGLPRTYKAQTIDTPDPLGGGSFGWGVASADLTGDGKLDLLVAQAQDPTSSQVFVFDGASGAHIDTIKPPELNPDANPDPVIGFVYIETMPDIGSCPGGDGPDADKICDDAVVGPGDGIPEILVGARGKRVNAADGTVPATLADRQVGRGYVLDGKTRAVLKRIDMPIADRQAEFALPGAAVAPQFGRVMISPQALPPCAGSPAEDNNQGVGPCPDMPVRSRIGDLNGDGFPDIVITARNYVEAVGGPAPATPAATSQCATQAVGTRCTSGKAWAYSGAAIAGSNPQTILDTAMYSIKNPLTQTGGSEFGGNLYRIGDVNSSIVTCSATPADPTCAPEFVIPARNLSYPFAAPTQEFTGVGAAFLIDGSNGNVLTTPGGTAITSPEPQKLSQFSGSFNGGRPVGDLGASTAPDILLPAALQNASLTDDGKIWAFNGVGGGGGATGSWQFASMTDPAPSMGGNFGGAFTGVGDVVTGPDSPANELLVGGFHFDPFTEASNNHVGEVHFVNVQTAKNLMTIPQPDGVAGDGFGVGLVPMGDMNADGFLDFAVSAYLADGVQGGQGRAWIFRSDNTAPPPPPETPAAPEPIVPKTLQPGKCANRTVGTAKSETLDGTIAGDEIFGFAGNDKISGFQDRDCLDGGTGNDTLEGGDDADKAIGGSGTDRLVGGSGRDSLYGGSGKDRLIGGTAGDLLAGGSDNDRLFGGAGDDQVFGEAGNDYISGGSGRNRIDGGKGNDTIDARNGKRDRVICGKGRDRVRADRSDRLNGCEKITYGGKIK